MSKQNREILLKRAEKKFLEGAYKEALFSFALVLRDYPETEEAKVGVYLSDFAQENGEEAQALYDYYQVIKHERDNAIEIIDEILLSIDETKEKIFHTLEALEDEEEIEVDSEGISYSDFKAIAKQRGSFKRTLEDVVFSTKVIIREKEEFIDFIKTMVAEGYREEALGYLESTLPMFENDHDILKLYSVVLSKETK